MSTPTDPLVSETTYFVDAENAAEMARLTRQDRFVTKNMGGLFPEGFDLSTIHDVLDIACGPGAWALDLARTYPNIKVMGIDISQLMIAYASAQARKQGLSNAAFKVMDALKPLNFPNNSFDLVNARMIFGFMPATAWPTLMQESLRIARPGGLIRLTECEWGITNSPACEKLNGMFTRTLQLAGQSFSPDGRHVGITPMLGRLLRDAGCQNIQKQAHAYDFSAGTEGNSNAYQDLMVFYKLIQPFLIKMGVTTQEEVDILYHQALEEIVSEDFCGIWFYLTAWGEKP